MMKKKQMSAAQVNALIAKMAEGWTPEKDMEIVRSTQYANLGISMKGRVISEEARLKIGLANKGNNHWVGKTHTEETRAKMRARVRGPVSEETRAKQSAIRTGKKIKISAERREEIIRGNKERSSKPLSINGVVYESITEAFRILGADRRATVRRINSLDERWKDYFWVADGPKKVLKHLSKKFVLTSPDGVRYTGFVIAEFIREHPEFELERNHLGKLLNGTWKQYKGWTGYWSEPTAKAKE
jgi:hypothetical protein